MMNKRCSRCKKVKPISEFNRQRTRKDSYQDFCRHCIKTYHAKWYQNNKEKMLKKSRIAYEQNKVKRREQIKLWQHNNPEIIKESQIKYANNNPQKRRAKSLVDTAKRTGKLIPPVTCEKCGKHGRVEAHHSDYSKPLQVQWLCKKCHIDITFQK